MAAFDFWKMLLLVISVIPSFAASGPCFQICGSFDATQDICFSNHGVAEIRPDEVKEGGEEEAIFPPPMRRWPKSSQKLPEKRGPHLSFVNLNSSNSVMSSSMSRSAVSRNSLGTGRNFAALALGPRRLEEYQNFSRASSISRGAGDFESSFRTAWLCDIMKEGREASPTHRWAGNRYEWSFFSDVRCSERAYRMTIGDDSSYSDVDVAKRRQDNSSNAIFRIHVNGALAMVSRFAYILVLFSSVLCGLWRWRKGKTKEVDWSLEPCTFQSYSYKELAIATNDFTEKLEEFGINTAPVTYRGYLRNQRCVVAIKMLQHLSKRGLKEVESSVKIISKMRHPNLLQLIGWCRRRSNVFLVYEYNMYAQQGSLASHLFDIKGTPFLTWDLRYGIARDIASVLSYLHGLDRDAFVGHGDIRSSNIMLDSDFQPKLGPFSHQSTCLSSNPDITSKSSDIYNFGKVLLEIACGRPFDAEIEDKNSLLGSVRDLYVRGRLTDAADLNLGGLFDEIQMERLLVVGLWCAHPQVSYRAKTEEAVACLLNLELPLPIFSHLFLEQVYASDSVVIDPAVGLKPHV